MMDVNGLIDESIKLFNEKQYAEAIEILNQAWDAITDKSTQVIEQMLIHSWLGRCYFAQAEKTKDTDKADEPFKLAVEHYRQRLKLAKQLPEEQASISICEQIDVQVWLGHHYLTYAKRTKYVDKASELFEQSVEHYEKWLQLTEQLENKQDCIWQQTAAQSWLVYCYVEQAKRIKNASRANDLSRLAIKHNDERLTLAKQLENKRVSIQEQIDALSWFCGCYLEQAIKTKDMNEAAKLFKQATAFAKQNLRLAGQLEDEQIRIQQQIFARFRLGLCYIERVKRIKNTNKAEVLFKKQASKHLSAAHGQLSQLSDGTEQKRIEKIIRQSLRDVAYLNEDWHSYFEKKKQEIQESLFKGKTSQPQDAVSTVLAVLHITPIELGFTPMAHYTSPHVCHILFGIVGNETASPMRLGSSTYMNDPSEGRGLLELLNQQDLELENKADGASHNAFFTCFSSRVNDLNQFRLYGKEDGVEASGCCLVFNKNGDWLKEADVSAPFRSLSEMSRQNSDDLPKVDEYEKLPLYQVAYIAYKDEYIADKKCGIWFPSPEDPKFGIRLKPVGNEDWHQFRLEKLKKALEELIEFFKDNSAVSDEDKEALEYIRYLFKDFAFRDEEEFRLLVIKPIDSEEIEYCDKTQSVYVLYADIRNQVDEVILGTNYEKTGNQRKAEVFRYQMKQKCPDVKVSRSTLPINPPNK